MIDPLGTLIKELRDLNIASGRVRGGEPAPKSQGYEGDALSAGHYKRFVVLSRLGGSRLHRVPFQEVRVGFRAYGATYQDAAALYGELSDAVDNVGPRLTAGVAIYQSLDEVGGTAGKDPDTGQPYESGVIVLYAGTQTVVA